VDEHYCSELERRLGVKKRPRRPPLAIWYTRP
jgi:hypothetical protein